MFDYYGKVLKTAANQALTAQTRRTGQIKLDNGAF
jgi:hypothetical protein